MTQEHTSPTRSWFHLARKVVVAVVGFSVLAFGVALIVLPGPASLVIPLGLAILATEFLWARKLLDPIGKVLRRLKAHAQRMLGRPSQPAGPPDSRRRSAE
jgi:tellurite resistance protein TerC